MDDSYIIETARLMAKAHAEEYVAPVIDLRRRYDIKISVNLYVPACDRFEARDLETFDPDPESRWNIYGSGASIAEATSELLDLIAELRVAK